MVVIRFCQAGSSATRGVGNGIEYCHFPAAWLLVDAAAAAAAGQLATPHTHEQLKQELAGSRYS